jgi:hypothetical protein
VNCRDRTLGNAASLLPCRRKNRATGAAVSSQRAPTYFEIDMTQRQKELKTLIRKMSSAELSEAISLLQAEMRTRGHVTAPVGKDWKNVITR